jgi:RimJ/RimL family protein N-acetyltransferase
MNLTYRKILEKDIPVLIDMVSCPFIQELTLFQNAKKDGRTPSKIFNDLVQENEEPVFHSFIVFNNDEAVAFLNRVITSAKPGYIIVGGWVDKNHRGQGIFGKALTILINDLKQEYPERDFFAMADEKNAPSLHTLDKIGFRREGRSGSKINFVYP